MSSYEKQNLGPTEMEKVYRGKFCFPGYTQLWKYASTFAYNLTVLKLQA